MHSARGVHVKLLIGGCKRLTFNGEMQEGCLRADVSALATRVSLNHLSDEGQH